LVELAVYVIHCTALVKMAMEFWFHNEEFLDLLRNYELLKEDPIPRRRWNDNINVCPREMSSERGRWKILAQNHIRWRAFITVSVTLIGN
jgi:hypothetical protein